jgi:beta-mannosidase
MAPECHELCDELGLLVWQEFPLSSSGTENWPPEEPRAMDELVEIARSYIARRQHHASLLLWCGGNELQGDLDGNQRGIGRPVTLDHPLMKRWQALVDEMDPGRRFLATSASGPRFCASEKDFGKELHWDVHGPWNCDGDPEKEWTEYWQNDDALFRSELGCPGTSPVDIIKEYSDGMSVLPGTMDNPLWRRTSWWIQWPQFLKDHQRKPRNIEEFVAWSQERQCHALDIAVRACKDRFPRIGGVILWMGRDAFPCTANTSIVDFHGRPKPAALAIGKIFRTPLKAD